MSSGPPAPDSHLKYQRSRFLARLPLDRLYVPSHYWIQSEGPDLWRVGFTRFAKRMLGEIVECGFDVKPGTTVALGQLVGWIEAFKAVSDLYCVGEGRFLEANERLRQDPGLIDRETDGEGWLYRFEGRPDARAVDAQGYAAILDVQIDKMLGDEDAARALGDEDCQ